MSLISLLVYADGVPRAISLAELLPSHRVIVARVGGTIARLTEEREGAFPIKTSIGVKWFEDLHGDVTVAQFDLFHATNESRIKYPDYAIGAHQTDYEAQDIYIAEAMKRIDSFLDDRTVNELTKEFARPIPTRRDTALGLLKNMLENRMRTDYINENRYLEYIKIMTDSVLQVLRDRPRHSVMLLIDEDANSPGNLVALNCWDQIKHYVSGVVLYNREGITEESKATALAHAPRYITFFDAVFNGEERQLRAKIAADFELAARPDLAGFNILFATPMSAVNTGYRFELGVYNRKTPAEYSVSTTGIFFRINRINDYSSGPAILDKLLGSKSIDCPPIYADRFISHPELPAKFLTGYMGLLESTTGLGESLDSAPLVENYERDEQLLNFAESIDYKFFAWSGGEPRMRTITDMTGVLFPKRE